MQFIETGLPGAFIIEIDRIEDDRGFFARSWCSKEFSDRGLPGEIKQTSISFNPVANTLRGLHFSTFPCQEGKVVRCTAGAMLDIIVDVRPGSPSFLEHISVELSADRRNAIYVPPGFLHGYQTLASDTEIYYMMTEEYQSGYADGFRWNDPAFNIDWPEGEKLISDRDNNYPDFDISKVKGFASLLYFD